MPGFSNYMQSVGDGYLIGVGRNSDWGFYSGPQVSLFDIKDLSNPTLVNRLTIPAGRSGGLGIFNDHHVVAYYADQGILTVSMPAAVCEVASSWSCSPINDLYVFRVDTSQATPGLTLIGTIAHDDSVLRSVEVGDRLISISEETVEVHSFAQPEAVLASLTINPPGGDLLPGEPWPIMTPLPIFWRPPLIVTGTLLVASPAVQIVPSPQDLATPVVATAADAPALIESPLAAVLSWTTDTFVGPRLASAKMGS